MKDLKKDFSIIWQQAKEITRKYPTCSFYTQTLFPAGSNPTGTQINLVNGMCFTLQNLVNFMHHTIDTCTRFQWVTALNSEKANSVIKHLLEVIDIMGISVQIKTDNAPAYVSSKMNRFCI